MGCRVAVVPAYAATRWVVASGGVVTALATCFAYGGGWSSERLAEVGDSKQFAVVELLSEVLLGEVLCEEGDGRCARSGK